MRDSREFTLNKSAAPGFIQQMADQLGQEIEVDCQRHTINFPPEIGKGQMTSYSVGGGLDALIFNVDLFVDLTIRLTGDFHDPISFITLAHGDLRVKSDLRDFTLKPLQCTIHGGFGDTDYRLHFPLTEGPLLVMVSFVHKKVFFEEIDCKTLDVPQKLLEVIKGINDISKDFLFQEIYHLPAINALQDIIEQKQIGLLNSTFAAGKIHENLFLILNEYKKYVISGNARFLRDREKIKLIRNAEKILITHLQDPPTIPELAKMVGINQQTLKQGFRQLYGETINNYLNEKRLEQAGILIRGGKLSLGEIARTIGYSNPGYFSKRFKEKYGVAPRDFLLSTAARKDAESPK